MRAPRPRLIATYWIVVALDTGHRNIFRSHEAAKGFAVRIGNCELFPSTIWRKPGVTRPDGGGG